MIQDSGGVKEARKRSEKRNGRRSSEQWERVVLVKASRNHDSNTLNGWHDVSARLTTSLLAARHEHSTFIGDESLTQSDRTLIPLKLDPECASW